MNISIGASTDDAGRPVLEVAGAIDVMSRVELLDAGRRALAAGSHSLVLDLGEVTFIDSTGLGALVELGRDAEDAGGELVIRNPSPRVLRILDLTGLADAWPVEADAS